MLEDRIQELNESIQQLIEKLDAQTTTKQKTKPKNKETKKPKETVPAKEKPAEEKPVEDTPGPNLTADYIGMLCQKKNKEAEGNNPLIKAIIKKHGGRLINDLKPEVYEAVVADLEAL
jgi:hypothetical protein